MATWVFPTITTGVTVETTGGGLTGDGSSGNKLAFDFSGLAAPPADTALGASATRYTDGFWSGQLKVGAVAPSAITAMGYHGLLMASVDGIGSSLAMVAAGGSYNDIDFFSMRGTLAAPEVVQVGDYLGLTTYGGYNGTSFSAPIDIQVQVTAIAANTNIEATYEMNVGSLGSVQPYVWLNGDTGVITFSNGPPAATSPGLLAGEVGGALKVRTKNNAADADFAAKNGTFSGNVEGAGFTLTNATALKTDTTTAHTALIQAYDVDGTAYKTFGTLTNGNTPDFTIAPPSGGTVTVQATTYKSSDASAGITQDVTTATLVGKTMTFKNGLLTGFA